MLAVDSRLRKQPSQGRSRLTVDAFLEAADRVLRREGYEAASTNRLARVAGFSVGSLYQYFDDKQAVIGTLIDRELRREARDLVANLDGQSGSEVAEVVRSGVEFLLVRRLDFAHLHRTLADHSTELGDQAPLAYVRHLQAPLAGAALQRVASPHFVRMGDGEMRPRLGIVAGLVHAATHFLAVESPAHVPPGVLADTLVRTITSYLDSVGAPNPEASDLVARWRDDAKGDRRAADRRARRLQEVRTFLLRGGPVDSEQLEPTVFVGAAVSDLVFEYGLHPAGAFSQDELAVHFVRLIAALPR